MLTSILAKQTARFARDMRNLSMVGLGIAVLSELAAHLSTGFPEEMTATVVMSLAFAAAAASSFTRLSRAALGRIAIATFGVIGWYLARVAAVADETILVHQGALFVTLAAAHSLLSFSVLEFVAVALVFVVAFLGSSLAGQSLPAAEELFVMSFYVAGAAVMAVLGIVSRTRLQRSEAQARVDLEHLNVHLQSEVTAKVQRIRRAELLGRYLPPALSDAVLEGQRGVELQHAQREVTVLTAVPCGFLESLAGVSPARVAVIVNAFVVAVTRAAAEYGGTVDRCVGPRVTVLFGAIEPGSKMACAKAAVGMAERLRQDAHSLLREWEREGLAEIRLRMAMGLSSGPLVVGTFGSERQVEYSALGTALVRAHHLAERAIAGELRCDDTVVACLREEATLLPGEPLELEPGVTSPTYLVSPLPVAKVAEALREAPSAGAPLSVREVETLLGPYLRHVTVPMHTQSGDQAKSTGAWAALHGAARLHEGQLFDGRYLIEASLGRGGMAEVYRARHLALGQARALKLILPERLTGPAVVEELRREAEATARMRHPNVVQLIDFGRSLEGSYYMALDFVDGRSLAQVLAERGPLPWQEVARIGVDVSRALSAAHDLKIVHRDLKPANVLIDAERRTRVTDFGVAQAFGVRARHSRGVIAGTPGYMSPEQCLGAELDERSDLYSFGVMLYELLTGKLPHEGATALELVSRTIERAPIPVTKRGIEAPRELCDMIMRCLAKEREFRPLSADVVRETLRTCG